jgi:hypothetical protein
MFGAFEVLYKSNLIGGGYTRRKCNASSLDRTDHDDDIHSIRGLPNLASAKK